jgi:hypothetical protein
VPLNVAATIDHHRSILKEMLPAHLIIVAGHSPHEELLLVLRIDDPEFLDCYFQRVMPVLTVYSTMLRL